VEHDEDLNVMNKGLDANHGQQHGPGIQLLGPGKDRPHNCQILRTLAH
jgi:hypothetical protein